MKTCFKCGEPKPIDDFYRHPRMTDGHLGKCKSCTRGDVRANRAAKREYYIAYDRQRTNTTARIAESKKRHPARHRARVHVRNAIVRGKLTRGPCELCGDTEAQAHHDDYAQPLAVRWLCRKHHAELHRRPF